MVFLVFSIFQKISTGYPILKFEFPLKICTKNVHLNMKILSNKTPNQDGLVVHPSYFFPRFEPPDFLLTAFFFFDGFLGFTIRSSILKTVWYNMTYYTFRYQKVNFTLSQVLWFRQYNSTKIWSNGVPQNVIFKFSEVWRKQGKPCI